MAGAAPTGVRVVDFVLVAIAAMVVTTAAATAPWWALTVACGVAAVSASRPLLIAIALSGVALTIFIGARRQSLVEARCLAALAAVQVFARLDSSVFFGFTAVVACTTLGAVFVLSVYRRERKVRRRVWSSVAVVAAMAVAALIGLAVAAMSARPPLDEANRQTNAGIRALNTGDMSTAADAFAAAAHSFADADRALSTIWAQPSQPLPGRAQHRDGATKLARQERRLWDAGGAGVAEGGSPSLQVSTGTSTSTPCARLGCRSVVAGGHRRVSTA
jgi:hypothetical protein